MFYHRYRPAVKVTRQSPRPLGVSATAASLVAAPVPLDTRAARAFLHRRFELLFPLLAFSIVAPC